MSLTHNYAEIRHRLRNAAPLVGPPKPDKYREYQGSVVGYIRSRYIPVITPRHRRPKPPAQIINRPHPITTITTAVCEHFDVSKVDLVSPRKWAFLVLPRHVVMYLARTMTDMTLPQIGVRLGGRDHTTVLHGVSCIKGALATDSKLSLDVAHCRQRAIELDPFLNQGGTE